jgi:hypothetical protein
MTEVIEPKEIIIKEIIIKIKKPYVAKHKNMKKIENKKYYDKNKQKIIDKALVECICKCGRSYQKNNKTKHYNTDIHIINMRKLDLIPLNELKYTLN